MSLLLSPDNVEQIASWGRDVAPEEACGLLFSDGTLIRLPNRSDEPNDSYKLRWRDAMDAIETLGRLDLMSLAVSEVLVWHTHPAGFVGPSQRDMRSKAQGVQYAVVALTDPPIASRF